ncbi:MAG: NAD(P)/FAD-dependent oxidoreductase [Elusimicrobiota bacterium]
MPNQLDRADLLVIGGGPAGTTLACLVKKYAPTRRVVLVEKSPGPRHHIGESLLPGLVPILKEMGVFEKIDSAGFPKKIGANYVWGKDRTVWENDFNEVNISEMLRRFGAIPETIEYAWQVRRSRYDEILLAHAEQCGVEVRRGVRASGLIEEDGVVVGARLRGTDGLETAVRSEILADCSGQEGFLSRWRPIRSYHPSLRNVAGYAYYRGARWKYVYSGQPDKTKIFVCSTGQGWFWYIPIDDGVVSVGLVTTADNLKDAGGDLRRMFDVELARCAEIAPLLDGAARIEDFDGSGESFFMHSDWSYLNREAAGPGWLAAGDAAVFVDPILSTGVTLAHVCGHRAAYTVLSHWNGDADRRGLLWSDYSVFCRESAAQYFVMALFWYGNDREAERWWSQAARLQRALLPAAQSDKQAFVAVSSGLTQYYDRLLFPERVFEDSPTRPESYPFYVNVLGGAADAGRFGDDDVPRLVCPYRFEFSFLPAVGEGRLFPVKRVRFMKEAGEDVVRDALNPRRFVVRHHADLLAALDGKRRLREIGDALARKGVPDWWWNGPGRRFIEELAVLGLVETPEIVEPI